MKQKTKEATDKQFLILIMITSGMIIMLSFMYVMVIFESTDKTLFQWIVYWIVFAGLLYINYNIIMGISYEWNTNKLTKMR